MENQPISRPQLTRTSLTQNADTHNLPRARFEPTTSFFERSKTICTLKLRFRWGRIIIYTISLTNTNQTRFRTRLSVNIGNTYIP